MKKNKRISSIVLAGVCALALSACIPQDETVKNERQKKQIESQIEFYSKAFQQYSRRSMNALVSSEQWRNGTIIDSEGLIDLTSAEFGSLNMGGAAAYLSSAFCNSPTGPIHITWFDNADAHGNLTLKGIGKTQIGRANMRIKSMMPNSNFGVSDGTNINMVDGTTLALGSGCSDTITFPTGTTVAAFAMKIPNNIAVKKETRTILKTDACPTNQVGVITKSINADFYSEPIESDKKVKVGTFEYVDENDLIANHPDSDWTEISENCITEVNVAILSTRSSETDIIDDNILNALSSNIKASFSNNLKNITCTVVEKMDVEDIDNDGDTTDMIPVYNTCM